MAFRGWPAEAIEFYEGLEADNTRAYWQDHKKEYEELVKGPMVELLAELAGEFGEGKIFRPFRDVRFSKDKSPYKTATELVRLVTALRKAGIEVAAHDTLKTAPKGYPKDHPRIELLRHKGLIAWKQWPVAAWMGTARAKQRVVDFLVAARPLNSWLDTHVGAS